MKNINAKSTRLVERAYKNANGLIPQTKPKFVNKRVLHMKYTLNTVLTHWADGKFTFPEEYQRGEVTNWKNFGRQWVTTLFSMDGFSHFDKLHIRQVNTDFGEQLQVVEGGQRLRAINAFFNNGNLDLGECTVHYRGNTFNLKEFTWNEIKTLCESDDTIKKYVDEVLTRAFDISLYEGYELPEIAEIFCKINNKTPLNAQELRNAFGTDAATAIRKTARFDATLCNRYKFHPIFEQEKTTNGSFKGRWMKINPKRYEYEELLAEFCYFEDRYEKDLHFEITPYALDTMYRRFKVENDGFKQILDRCCDRLTTIHRMVKINDVNNKKNRSNLSKGYLFALYGLLYHIEKVYKKDYSVFYEYQTFFNWFLDTHEEMSETKEIDPVTKKKVETAYGLAVRVGDRTKEEISQIFQCWENTLKNITDFNKIGIILSDK